VAMRTGGDGAASLSDMRDGRSDDELLRAAATGDRQAFETYYRRNAPWLEIRLRRRCRDAELAADVVQEAFLAVWRSAASYRGTGQSAGWLWSIASRRLIDAHRRRAVRAQTVGEPHADLLPAPSAEEEVLASSYGARLALALDRLSPELRAVLQATVLDGLSVRETAVLLDIPEGTVKSRAVRARRQLREALA
jgi:RNA polymerase sigma-70 factor, ECF subfamily